MSARKKIAVIFGTRPDTIKLAPIILALQKERRWCSVITIATAQHRKMLDQVLGVFKIRPDYDLDSMLPRQSLAEITRNTIVGIDTALEKIRPDLVLVQGDTTTTFVGSLAAFYRNIPVGHVEAGLRTNNKAHPFPEEINRRLTSAMTDLHFAPTETARKALLREHVMPTSIFVTGNSVIDALHIALHKPHRFTDARLRSVIRGHRRVILVTLHRRENWGKPMHQAASALRRIARRFPDTHVLFPVHLNPVVRETVVPILAEAPNITLVDPLDYLDFIHVMAASHLIITDSGGVQEEGPALGKPVLVLREVTERPEAVAFGTVKLLGLNEERIYSTACRLLTDRRAYARMAEATNPYGDGKAAHRTVQIIKRFFGVPGARVTEFIPR